MANLIQKLIKKAPPRPPLQSLRAITGTILNPAPPIPNITESSEFTANNPIPILNPTPSLNANADQFFLLCRYSYPNFPFGLSLNPVPTAGVDKAVTFEAADDDSATDDARTVWADSVKKKRKRKMNKHKYKKLRKRLRRKART